jgi:Holliday junction resolvase RusA-like endonuclease
MRKRPLKLCVRIPNFQTDTVAWRRGIHAAIDKVRGSVQYDENDKLEIEICLYLQNPKLTILDVDNRVKDVFDALQGFMRDKGAVVRNASFRMTIRFTG